MESTGSVRHPVTSAGREALPSGFGGCQSAAVTRPPRALHAPSTGGFATHGLVTHGAYRSMKSASRAEALRLFAAEHHTSDLSVGTEAHGRAPVARSFTHIHLGGAFAMQAREIGLIELDEVVPRPDLPAVGVP